MKILQVFDYISLPHGGGTVDFVYKLSQMFVQRGHQVTIYAGDFELDRKYIDSLDNVDVRLFHNWIKLFGMQLMPGIIGESRKKLQEFDIIHTHCLRSSQNLVLHHFASKYGVPYIVDTHGSLPRTHGSFSFKAPLKWLFDITFGYRILRDACSVIAESELGKNEYMEFGVSDEKIALIPPPFEVEEFEKLPPPGIFRNKHGLQDKKIVMFLGRIHRIKGLDFMVESFYELTKQRDDAVLVIVGNDDGFKPILDSLIDSLNIQDKVLFAGFLSGDDKLSALVDADVVVQTSVYEQGAWAPLEGVLCGTPIIVTRHTGAGEDVKRMDAGYLVEYDNKNEMAELLMKVFDEPAEAISKAEKAAKYIRDNLSMAKKVNDYEKLYTDCIKANKLIKEG